MLNPSTANETEDDPTIRRCIGFAKAHGYSRVDVVNVYSFRATDPKDLLKQPAARLTGPDHQRHIDDAVAECAAICVAWGASSRKDLPFDPHGKPVFCLGKTTNGSPRHPLYLPADTKLEPWP